jgi:two-component system sensor histidine kinase GlrK
MSERSRPVSRYYPKSFLKLLLLGFAVVLLPTLVAFYGATTFVERLAKQSQRAVTEAAVMARAGRVLVDQTTAMERSARQYVIMRDPSLRELYRHTRDEFDKTVSRLMNLPLDPPQQQQLREIAARVKTIDSLLEGGPPRPPQANAMTAEFVALGDLADAVLAQSNQVIDREIVHMQRTTDEAQQILFWQILATLPLGVLIALAFTFLIARPIRQIDSAIRQLGRAEFSEEIIVDGPDDLSYLGRQLDWLRRRLVELEEQKDRFLRGVSHELKTPLTALHEGIALLNDGIGGNLNARQLEILGIMRANSAKLQRQIEDLLSFQRAQFGGEALTLETIDAASLARRAADEQRVPALAREVSIVPRLESVALLCNPENIRLVLENLLVNAVKFSPRGGVVTLDLQRHAEQLWIDVADQGPGIEAADRDRVFEWFYQGRTAPDSAVKGSGLGLAIAREIAQAHGGSIVVVDQPQPGARFRVQLPLIQVKPA